MVLSFYLLQVFPPQRLKFARRKEQTQPIQTQHFPLLARLCVSCLVHCWCPKELNQWVSVGRTASATLQMHPGYGGEFCGGFFSVLKCARNCRNFSEKIVKKNRSKIRHSFFKNSSLRTEKFTNFFVHLQILDRHLGSKTHRKTCTNVKNVRVNLQPFWWGWLALVKTMSPLLLRMTSLKYCQDFSAQAFGAGALKQLKAPHTVSTHRRQNPKTKVRPKSVQLELSAKK